MKKPTKHKKSGARPVTFATLSKRLSELGADDGTAQPDPPGDTNGEKAESPPRRKAVRPTAKAIVVGAAFEAAAPKAIRRLLMRGKALAAIVVVPTETWVAAVAAYVRSTFGDRWTLHVRDGADRKRDASFGSDDAARDLSKGMCVMGIAADPKLLPASLQSAADVMVHIAPPDAAVLRRAITRFARRSPGELDAGTAFGLDLYEIVAAFRPDETAGNIARRLGAAARSRAGSAGRVPDLSTAIEYGEAQVWGMALARDIADYRGGRIVWSEVDRGVCLHSAPGMGKTLFAQILANACGVPLVTTSVGAWFANGPGYLDSVIKEMRTAFARARALASPCSILFLDEIDALPNRAALSPRGRDWWTPVITDALTLLDSAVSGRDGIVVVGATNAIDRVDEALLRPGRLEKSVEVTRPDAAGAVNILRFHLNGSLAEDLSSFGPLVDGMTGAEIMLAVRSARRAARTAGRALTRDDLKGVLLPVDQHPPARLRRMSVHEAAHAVAAIVLRCGVVRRVALKMDGISGGHMEVRYFEDDLPTRKTVEDRVTVALAARAAERLFTGSVSIGGAGGADSDIGFSTALVAALHAAYGLRGPPVYLGAGSEEMLRAVALDPGLRERVGLDLVRLERRAARLVATHREAIDAVALLLAERRHLDGAEVEAIVRARSVRRRRTSGTGES
jgi:hypothetical protein